MLIGCAAQRVQSRWCAETLCMEKSSTHGREDPAWGDIKRTLLLGAIVLIGMKYEL